MDGLRVILLFALLVTISWFILSEIVILTYNYIENRHLQCTVSPKTFVFKAQNDTTDYNNLKNSECFCEKVTCAKRCCTDCTKMKQISFSSFFPYYVTENITAQNLCPNNMELYYLNISKAYIQKGYLISGAEKTKHFCVIKNGKFRLCMDKSSSNNHVTIAMIISMPCLIITFLVYLILPEKNVHKRALLNYVFSLLCGCIIQVTIDGVQRNRETPLNITVCHLIGYSLIFFFVASFFWMNVMSIDMWLAFSDLRGLASRKQDDRKMFMLFCLYAWGMPFLLSLMVYLMNNFADEAAIYHPQLGKPNCFLSVGYPNMFYFYLPVAILITTNIVLCVLTAWKITKVKKETGRQLTRIDSKKHKYENDKQKFILYVKLVFAMGINWSLEVISFLVIWQWKEVPKSVWYVSDLTNAAYGVIIFFIFVFKRNVWIELKKRYYLWKAQRQLVRTLSSETGHSSNISTTEAVSISTTV